MIFQIDGIDGIYLQIYEETVQWLGWCLVPIDER